MRRRSRQQRQLVQRRIEAGVAADIHADEHGTGGRARTRREVRAIHREWGLTVLQVTHDFTEAGLLGDVAILLDKGRVLQSGPPEEVFRRPASPYIAEFLGAENVLAGTARVLGDVAPDWVEGAPPSLTGEHHAIEFSTGGLTLYTVGVAPSVGPSYAVIRAEEVIVTRTPAPSSARNTFRGTVREVALLGAYARVTLDVGGVPLVAALTARVVIQGRATCTKEGRGFAELIDLTPGGPQTLAVGKTNYQAVNVMVTLTPGFNAQPAIRLTPVGGCAVTPVDVPCTCTTPDCQ